MAVKKKVTKKKAVKSKAVKEPELIQIDLRNVFPYIVTTLNSMDKKIDRLQKTVDAVGFAVVENK